MTPTNPLIDTRYSELLQQLYRSRMALGRAAADAIDDLLKRQRRLTLSLDDTRKELQKLRHLAAGKTE